MIRKQLEHRIRTLEQGLDLFTGLEWVVNVGKLAEIKSVIFDLPEGADKTFESRISPDDLARLDGEIALSLDHAPAADVRHKAFHSAYGTLRRWLDPNFPGLRPVGRNRACRAD